MLKLNRYPIYLLTRSLTGLPTWTSKLTQTDYRRQIRTCSQRIDSVRSIRIDSSMLNLTGWSMSAWIHCKTSRLNLSARYLPNSIQSDALTYCPIRMRKHWSIRAEKLIWSPTSRCSLTLIQSFASIHWSSLTSNAYLLHYQKLKQTGWSRCLPMWID